MYESLLRFGSNPLCLIAEDRMETAEFFDARSGVMVNHEGQGQQMGMLGGRIKNSKSLTNIPWHIDA